MSAPGRAGRSADAGFSSIRRVEMENPFNNLYEAMP